MRNSSQPSSEVSDATSGLKIKREILVDSTQTKNINSLKVGRQGTYSFDDHADRDYDFVQVVDRRAACLEPVNQLSGCYGGRLGRYGCFT